MFLLVTCQNHTILIVVPCCFSGQKELAIFLRELRNSQVLRLIIDDDKAVQILLGTYIESLRGKALKSNEDALDALICLYTAGLYAIGSSGNVFGDTDSGYVWVPHGVCI